MIKFFLKPMSFIPSLIIMYMIYSFSAQDAADSTAQSLVVSRVIVEQVNSGLDLGFSESQVLRYTVKIEHYIRKAAHFTEYFILGVSLALPLYIYGLNGVLLILVTQMFCSSYAALDEFHQMFSEGRTPQMRDVIIDSAGAFFGIICTLFFCMLIHLMMYASKMHRLYDKTEHGR